MSDISKMHTGGPLPSVSMNQWLQADETGSESGLNYRTVNQLFACFISALWFLLVINFHCVII